MAAGYNSIDQISRRAISLDSKFTTRIISSNAQEDQPNLYLIHSTSTTDVRLYGEAVAKNCGERSLLSSFFFRRRFKAFPMDGKRLVATLAYQICVSPICPRELKVGILGALYAEPDIPEQSLENQLQRLIVKPLIRSASHLPATLPVIFVLDSVHDCERVEYILANIAQALLQLNEKSINAKVVVTSLSYQRVLTIMQQLNPGPPANGHIIAVPAKSSLFGRIQSCTFFLFDCKYNQPEILQRVIEVCVAISLWVAIPFCLFVVLVLLGWLVGFGLLPAILFAEFVMFPVVIVQAIAMYMGIMYLTYQGLKSIMQPRSL